MLNEKEILSKVLEETILEKKPKENNEGFVFEISEENFEKAIKLTIELSK